MKVVTARNKMTLYAHSTDIYSHLCRIVLAEKNVDVAITNVDLSALPEDLLTINPYANVPTLVDRDVVLYEPRIIVEYLDERFPHPPLLPVYPAARAQARLMYRRIEGDWISLLRKIELSESKEERQTYQKSLIDGLISVMQIFSKQTFFMSEQYSLLDCLLSVMLYRLQILGVEFPAQHTKAILQYRSRMFERESFQISIARVQESWFVLED